MKLEYLIVIFIIIMAPIMLVFSKYIDNQLTTIQTERTYDTRVFDATYDAVSAYQINTINNELSDLPTSKVSDIESAINVFFNSLTNSFNYTGRTSDAMNDYVPAVVFTMYDGYYIYSPLENTLTGVERKDDGTYNVAKEYDGGKVLHSLKPFVHYNCRYKRGDIDVVITYTMDNYIIIDGTVEKDGYVYASGYLIDNITDGGNKYRGIGISKNEKLKEYIDNKDKKEYPYAKINGVKYYYQSQGGNGDNDYIFYIDSNGKKIKQVENKKNNPEKFKLYYDKIMNNNSAYEYYKEALEFKKKIQEWGLDKLTTKDIVRDSENYKNYDFLDLDGGYIFKFGEGETSIENSNSNFNRHRQDVIRAVIQTNLSTAISSFKKYANSNDEYIMPKISDTDWEIIENNISVATFLQGLDVTGRRYNSYAVVANTLNKEYVDENDIYVIKSDNTYARVNDNSLINNVGNNLKTGLGYEPGTFKINFEKKRINETDTFFSLKYDSENPYKGSYTSIFGATNIASVRDIDMYRYVARTNNDSLKKTYYTALARERQGMFKSTFKYKNAQKDKKDQY